MKKICSLMLALFMVLTMSVSVLPASAAAEVTVMLDNSVLIGRWKNNGSASRYF